MFVVHDKHWKGRAKKELHVTYVEVISVHSFSTYSEFSFICVRLRITASRTLEVRIGISCPEIVIGNLVNFEQ